MAFTLLHNLYQYLKTKSERRITIAFVGLDGAGKVSMSLYIQKERFF